MSLYLYPYPRHMARRVINRPEQHQLNVNIREEDDAYILSALVPGLKAEDLNIQVLDDVLRIEGEYKADDAEYLMNELPSGSFTRSLTPAHRHRCRTRRSSHYRWRAEPAFTQGRIGQTEKDQDRGKVKANTGRSTMLRPVYINGEYNSGIPIAEKSLCVSNLLSF